MVRGWLVAAAIAVGGTPALTADVEIFWDGFDQGDLCAWSNTPPTYLEQEAFDESGANDPTENDTNAEIIPTRCAVVEGTIGEWYDSEPGPGVVMTPDTDGYELSLEGPALVRFRFERLGEQSLFQPYSFVLYNSSNYEWYGFFPEALPSDDPVLIEREFYLPEDGFTFLDPDSPTDSKDIPGSNKWWFFIDDFRNFDDCPVTPCGDEQNRYRLTITVRSIAGSTLPFPYSAEQVSYPADNSVLSYRIPDGVTNLSLTETILDQNNPFNSDLDSRLFIVKKVGMSLQTIAGNDDWEYSSGTPLHADSKIGSTPLSGGPYFVIVDHFGKFSADAVDFGLTIQYLQGEPRP